VNLEDQMVFPLTQSCLNDSPTGFLLFQSFQAEECRYARKKTCIAVGQPLVFWTMAFAGTEICWELQFVSKARNFASPLGSLDRDLAAFRESELLRPQQS
jgi:hypothetical protein